MRVLISRISPDVVGGAELSAFDQAVALKELGHEPILATNLRFLKNRAKKENIKTTWFPWVNRGPMRPLRIVFFFMALPVTYLWAPLLALWHRPDVINPHSREDQNAFTFSKWIHGKPVIWKDPADLRMQLSPEQDSMIKRYYRRDQLRAMKLVDHIYLLNKGDRQNLADKAGDWILDKTSVVPASILYRYYDRKKQPLDKPKDKLVIGTLARAEKNKGLQYIIEAAKQLDEYDNVEYWLVNDGAYKPELQLMASSYPQIKFKPHTDDVSQYLATFDILVHPAEVEGWGRIIKEGMYFGLPIIGSNTGGIALQLEHHKTGLLFDVGDVAELTKHLKLLIDDRHLRRKLGDNAKFKAEKDGDFVKIVEEQIIPIYQWFINI